MTRVRVAPGRPLLPALLLAAALLPVGTAGCGEAAAPPAVPAVTEIGPGLPWSAGWVTRLDPERAAPGYTLVLYRRRIPVLMDLAGRAVHAWPEARVKSRARLLPDGSLLAIGLGGTIVEIGWDGGALREIDLGERLPHHDVIRLTNGNTLVITRTRDEPTDELVELDAAGEVVWTWDSGRHLARWIAAEPRRRGDITHLNSVQELPPNPLHDAGDARFRPGNLLISARNLDAVFVVDRESGAVTWSWDRGLDKQHEALMIGPGLPGHGRILLFDNGYRDRHRRSAVLEIDPATGEVTWSYRRDGFYSPTGGLEQPLPNGNVLVASSRGGRIFEVTRAGETVWEWIPPFDPNRPHRYPPGHAPQLAALPAPRLAAVTPPPGFEHVDPDAYRFARRGRLEEMRIGGEERRVLRAPAACERLLLPAGARLRLGWGLAPTEPDGATAAGDASPAITFVARLTPEGRAVGSELVRARVAAGDRAWREREIDLISWSLAPAELCLEAEAPHGGPRGVWGHPVVVPAEIRGQRLPDLDSDLAAEEREARLEHLRALGYVD